MHEVSRQSSRVRYHHWQVVVSLSWVLLVESLPIGFSLEWQHFSWYSRGEKSENSSSVSLLDELIAISRTTTIQSRRSAMLGSERLLFSVLVYSSRRISDSLLPSGYLISVQEKHLPLPLSEVLWNLSHISDRSSHLSPHLSSDLGSDGRLPSSSSDSTVRSSSSRIISSSPRSWARRSISHHSSYSSSCLLVPHSEVC